MNPPAAWRLLWTGPRPGAWNMACDAALLDRASRGAGPPTLRFYEWDPGTISLGQHQPPPDAAAEAAMAAAGVGWVRRPTGGRAVWHGPPGAELTYAVVAPLSGRLAGGLLDAYRAIHEALADGFHRLGADVHLAPARGARPPGPRDRRACFAASVPGEIHAGGRKLVGSAQRRSRGALLQHGSIPLAGTQDPLEAIWPGCLPTGGATTVAEAAGRVVPTVELAEALAEALARALSIELLPAGLGKDELAAIEARIPGSSSPGPPLDTPARARRYSPASRS